MPGRAAGPGLDRDAVRLHGARGARRGRITPSGSCRGCWGRGRAGGEHLADAGGSGRRPWTAGGGERWWCTSPRGRTQDRRAGVGCWAVELRDRTGGAPRARGRAGPPGERCGCRAGVRLILEEPLDPGGARLWWARVTGGTAPGAAAPARAADPVRLHGAGPAAVRVPDGVRACRPADGGGGGDAERGPALHGGAGGGAGEPGCAVRAGHAAHGGGVGGGARAAVPGAVRGAARHRRGW